MRLTKSEYSYAVAWAKKIKAIKILGNKCKDCGEANFFILCFHHKNEVQKKIKIASSRYMPWRKWKEEIKKCELLCRNCHYLKHYKHNDIKKRLLKIAGQNFCNKCGYRGLALEFHHIKEDKKFNFGDITGKKIYVSTETIIKEMEKCIVLCRNCHSIEHIKTDKFDRLKHEIYKRVNTDMDRQPPANRQQVFDLLRQGLSQAEIGRKMGYAKSTINGIVKNIK